MRDGEAVTGEYSYVDPNGSLITVRYKTDADGYTETREVTENFLQGGAPVATTTAKPVYQTTRPTSGNSDLVAKIIAQLKPFISSTVNDALSGNRYGH